MAQADICGPAWAGAQVIADLNYAFYYGTAVHIRITLAFAIKTWHFNMRVQQQKRSSPHKLDADDIDDDTGGSSDDALNTRRHSTVLLDVNSAQSQGSSFSSWFCSNFSPDAKLTDAVQAHFRDKNSENVIDNSHQREISVQAESDQDSITSSDGGQERTLMHSFTSWYQVTQIAIALAWWLDELME